MIELSVLPESPQNTMKNIQLLKGFNKTWREHGLSILMIIIRFVKMITSQLHTFPFRKLTSDNFKALNDKSAYFRFYIDKQLIIPAKKLTLMDKVRYWFNSNVLINRIKTSYKNSGLGKVINPNHSMKIVFDSILLIVLIINVAYLPVQVSFDPNEYLLNILLLDVPDFVFLVAMVLKCNTAYYQSGVLINSRKKIVRNYLRNEFLWDLTSCIPLLAQQNNLLNLLSLFRLVTIVNLGFGFEENFNLRKNYGTYIDVAKLLGIYLFCSQMFACLFFYLAMYEISLGTNNTWVNAADLVHSAWTDQYISSMYWGTQTTLTIGYGDIVPTTITERGYVIFVALLNSILFGFTISNIGMIFTNLSEQKKFQREKMSIITAFVQKRKLNKDLEIRVRKFFEYYFQKQENRDNECYDLFKQLSLELNTEVRVDFYGKYLEKCELLKEYFSEEFIVQACLEVKEKLLTPDEVFIKRGNQIDALNFVIHGQLIALVDYEGSSRVSVIKEIKASQTIAENHFFTSQPLQYNIKSKQFTTVGYIPLDRFKILLEQYPKDKQQFLMLQHKLNSKEINTHCEVCSQSHNLQDCNVLFYQPLLKQVLKQQYLQKQERIEFQRQKRLKHRTFLDKLNIQESILTCQIDKEFIAEDQINEEFIVKYDYIRLRNCEINPPKLIENPLEFDKLQQRRNAVRLSIFGAQDELISSERYSENKMRIFNSNMGRSLVIDTHQEDIEHILYQNYIDTLKPDLVPYLDKMRNYIYYYPDNNLESILNRERAMHKFSMREQIKKVRRLLKKSTWTESIVPSQKVVK